MGLGTVMLAGQFKVYNMLSATLAATYLEDVMWSKAPPEALIWFR